MRTMNLTFTDRDFKALEKTKDKLNEKRKDKLNWERFIMLMHDGM